MGVLMGAMDGVGEAGEWGAGEWGYDLCGSWRFINRALMK